VHLSGQADGGHVRSSALAWASAAWMLFVTPAHHSCGSCSDHSGFGVESVRGVVGRRHHRALLVHEQGFRPVVDTSMPRKRRAISTPRK
jgi:hypothetical protein